MFYGATELANNLVGRKPKTNELRPSEFWAVNHVDLEVKRGQVLGIIGHNGCGKTTLLRLIAGIYPPDDGLVWVRGKVAALISLGVGFHPYLTGRENIFLNGTLLGIERAEIEEKLDEIIAFSELEEFINSPVATYSSGMRVRLGFSIAIAIEPDILLLDEILAVGDRTFKAKSYKMIAELSERTASILITHNMQMVSRICSNIIVMERGRFVFKSDNVGEGIEYYQQSQAISEQGVSGKGLIELKEFLISADSNHYSEWVQLHTTDVLRVKFKASMADLTPEVVSRILIYDSDFNIVGETFSSGEMFSDRQRSDYEVDVLLPSISLRAGSYTLSLEFIDLKLNQAVKKFHAIGSFQIIDDTIAQLSTIPRAAFYYDADWKLNPND
jgi:lipopolysaccharide transport system ATP-binding protein